MKKVIISCSTFLIVVLGFVITTKATAGTLSIKPIKACLHNTSHDKGVCRDTFDDESICVKPTENEELDCFGTAEVIL